MPALPDVPKVLKLVYSGILGGASKWVVTEHWSYSGTAPTDAQLLTFLGAVADSYATNIAPLMTTDRELTLLDVIDLTSATSAAASLGATTLGTRSDVALGADIAFILKRIVSRRYRGGHSRQYWPIGGDTALANAVFWGNTFVTAALDAFNALWGDIAAAGWTSAGDVLPVNVSYYEGFTNVTFPSGRARAVPNRRVTPIVDLVTEAAHNPKLGSQRRRNQQSA